jgi:hypothetical protein
MKFSERYKFIDARTAIQTESMDDALRNGLWNIYKIFIVDTVTEHSSYTESRMYLSYFYSLWHNFYKLPVDQIPSYSQKAFDIVREKFFNYKWYEVYDFVEFSVRLSSGYEGFKQDKFISSFNSLLTKELAGYRIIENSITPITDEKELDEISQAINTSKERRLSGVFIHLEAALEKLSDRANPDYRNSIKESISAIESIC